MSTSESSSSATYTAGRPASVGTGAAAHAANILIADDDALVSSPLRKMLVREGYHATCVETGWDATKALATGEYDLLVTDICMPGNMTLDVLRAPEVQAQHIPVILITGYPSVETAVGALRLEAVDYILKPVDPEKFLASVKRAITRKGALRTVRELEDRVGDVAAVLESVKRTLETALPAGGDPNRPVTNEEALKTRLSAPEFAGLSRREREILEMIARGQGTAATGARLGISVSTVRNHLKSIYRKVGVTSQVALVRKLLA